MLNVLQDKKIVGENRKEMVGRSLPQTGEITTSLQVELMITPIIVRWLGPSTESETQIDKQKSQ